MLRDTLVDQVATEAKVMTLQAEFKTLQSTLVKTIKRWQCQNQTAIEQQRRLDHQLRLTETSLGLAGHCS